MSAAALQRAREMFDAAQPNPENVHRQIDDMLVAARLSRDSIRNFYAEYNASLEAADDTSGDAPQQQPGATSSTARVETEPKPMGCFETIARAAIARGESRVLPIKIGGKNPAILWVNAVPPGNDINTMTTEKWAGRVESWVKEVAAQFPDLNCCVVAKPTEFTFVDCDSYREFIAGYEAFAAQLFPVTYTTSARENRVQIHFRQTDSTRALGNVAQFQVDGIDLSFRQHNEYVLAEGSMHKNGVDVYKRVVDAPIVPMPDKMVEYIRHLKTLVAKVAKESGAKDEAPRNANNKVPQGSIHPWMLTEAGKMRQLGMEQDEIETVLLRKVHEECEGPIDDSKIMQMAKSICAYEPTPVIDLVLNQTATGAAATQTTAVDADAKKQAQDEYNALVEKCQEQEERVDNPYPTEVWEGTPYLDFARICRGTGKDESYIPVEYFINGMMTTVGAICGNRVVPAFNPTLQARFITLLLSTKGGIGKNSVMDWCKIPFAETGLIYQGDLNRKFNNIGCIVADFGSARGMVETMSRHPRILQEYAEFSTVVEKFSIAGSGDAFRDMNLNLADNQIPNWSIIKGTKVGSDAPKEISNSILAGSTDERFQEMMMKSNWETFLQRMNIVPTDETRTKFKLVMPNLDPMKEKLLPRIQMLESNKLVWTLSPEAEAFGEQWFESLHERAGDQDSESVGRIQVYLFRIISHLVLWLAPLPTKIGIETMPNGGAIAIWSYQVPLELMKRAARVAEWQVTARVANMPVRGSTTAGVVENMITKWAFKQKSIRWIELKRRSKITRFGYKACHDSLVNLQRSGVLVVKTDPDAPEEQRSWVVVWHGSSGTHGKWVEMRGGKRSGAGRKPAAE